MLLTRRTQPPHRHAIFMWCTNDVLQTTQELSKDRPGAKEQAKARAVAHWKVKAAVDKAAKAAHAEGMAEQKKEDTKVVDKEVAALVQQREGQMKGIICNKTIQKDRSTPHTQEGFLLTCIHVYAYVMLFQEIDVNLLMYENISQICA